ncbi:MAG: hypothetical protein ACFHWZ_13285 [Phycisphaerales bacterium]
MKLTSVFEIAGFSGSTRTRLTSKSVASSCSVSRGRDRLEHELLRGGEASLVHVGDGDRDAHVLVVDLSVRCVVASIFAGLRVVAEGFGVFVGAEEADQVAVLEAAVLALVAVLADARTVGDMAAAGNR